MTVDFANWSGLVASRPAEVRSVSSVAEVQAAVARATAQGWAVRTAGTTHSHSDLLHTDGGLVLLTDELGGPPVVEPGLSRARIPGGTKLAAIGEPLWEAGFSLANQGDVDVQSMAGLVATGVHGTGRSLRSISDSVVGATIVTATGDLVSTDDDPELLEATRLNLGALGVVVDLTLRLLPGYHLHERAWSEALPSVIERLDDLALATRHFEFFWYPVTDKAYAKALNPCGGPVDPMDGNRGEYVDRSYVVFPSERIDKHTEMEYSVPADQGPGCFLRIRDLMQTRFPDVTWPAEYRTVAADEGWISPARGRPTVTISVHQGVGEPFGEFFAACESIFREHGGRPHWGKVHSLSAADLAAEHPDTWDRFWGVQARLDPDGRFLNGHLQRVAGR